MSRSDLRRAFRTDRMRTLYDEAVTAGWTAVLDGRNHVRMTSPDSTFVMVLSTTAVTQGRGYLNCRAVFRRWQRSLEVTDMTDIDPIQNAIDNVERREVYEAITGKDAPRAIPDIPDPEPLLPEPTCACGCGGKVPEEGKFLRGHWKRGVAGEQKVEKVSTSDEPKTKPRRSPSLFKTNGTTFTLDEVLTIARFGSVGGDDEDDSDALISLAKLEEGLRLVLAIKHGA